FFRLMSVYARYKKDPEGFRRLVELLETTPKEKRDRMVEVGMQEDAEFTRRALSFIITFAEITTLPDLELGEIINLAPARASGIAFSRAEEPLKEKVLQLAP